MGIEKKSILETYDFWPTSACAWLLSLGYILFTVLRDRGRVIKEPIRGYSKEMVNFIERWPATVKNLFILIREGWGDEVIGRSLRLFLPQQLLEKLLAI